MSIQQIGFQNTSEPVPQSFEDRLEVLDQKLRILDELTQKCLANMREVSQLSSENVQLTREHSETALRVLSGATHISDSSQRVLDGATQMASASHNLERKVGFFPSLWERVNFFSFSSKSGY